MIASIGITFPNNHPPWNHEAKRCKLEFEFGCILRQCLSTIWKFCIIGWKDAWFRTFFASKSNCNSFPKAYLCEHTHFVCASALLRSDYLLSMISLHLKFHFFWVSLEYLVASSISIVCATFTPWFPILYLQLKNSG